MRDDITIGEVPCDEECAQVGSENYREQAKKEMGAFIRQLRRHFGPEQGTARFAIKWFSHDFGTYGEVVCYFDDNDEEGANYAYNAEECPEHWDEEAKTELYVEA